MNQTNIIARSLMYIIPEGMQQSFQARLGIVVTGTTKECLGDFTFYNCSDIEAVLNQAKELISKMNIKIADDFTLVYPDFPASNDDVQAQLIDIAWEIQSLAASHDWIFSRLLPNS